MGQDNEKYVVRYKKYEIMLSERFLRANNAEGHLEQIKEKFINKYKLYEKMENTDDKGELIALANKVKENEFDIQELFNFNRDYAFHRWWEVPKCKCPVMDNQDMWGSNRDVHSSDCPIHCPKQGNTGDE